MAESREKSGRSAESEKSRNLLTVLRRHLGQRTVLGVAIPVLDD